MKKKTSKKSILNTRFVVIIEICIIAILLFSVVMVSISYFKEKKYKKINLSTNSMINEDKASANDAESESVSKGYIDADKYFYDVSTVISVYKADESEKTLDEKSALEEFERIGFNKQDILCNYNINGEMYDEPITLSDESTEKHPSYYTTYISSNNTTWSIFIIDNKILAYPITYNINSEKTTEVVLSEDEKIISYDSVTNKFFETIPNKKELIVINAGIIDSKLLDSLTQDEIDSYLD